MADRMRWRFGDTRSVVAAVNPDDLIEIGDLVYLENGVARAASTQADQGDEAANQQHFAGRFLGVAMQRSPVGDDRPIRVAATGVFEFVCLGESFELGDWVGADEADDGTRLENQRVTKVAQPALAVGRAAKRAPQPGGTVWIEICSTVMTGGVKGTTATA